MKKTLLVVLSALLVVSVSGCGSSSSKNQVKCTGTMSEGGMNMKVELTAIFDNDNKVKDADVTYDLDDKDTASQYCSLFKLFADEDKGVSVSCSGSKITIKGYAKMADEEDTDALVGQTKEAFIQGMEAEGLTCK